jgi:3-isopropylmalate dehydrogenase
MVLSAAMMLDWLGTRHGVAGCCHAAAELTRAVERAFADGTLLPTEAGGTAGTASITARIRHELQRPVASEFTA